MDTAPWIAGHVANALFWLWIYAWGGARWLEGTFVSGFLVNWLAPRWSAEGIRLFALCTLIVSGVGFAVGLFVPGLRCPSC